MNRILRAAIIFALSGGALAQMSATHPSAVPMPPLSEQYVQQLARRYQTLAGSQSNLESLVTGLRRASAITLAERSRRITFMPPTKPMGYGNVTRSLELAKRQLAAAGITRPSTEQLHAALMGGSITTAGGTLEMQGVLQLRAEGMGWGRVAHALGVPAGSPSSGASATRGGSN